MATGSVYCLVIGAILGMVAFVLGLAAVLHRIGHRKGPMSLGSATTTALTPRRSDPSARPPDKESP